MSQFKATDADVAAISKAEMFSVAMEVEVEVEGDDPRRSMTDAPVAATGASAADPPVATTGASAAARPKTSAPVAAGDAR